MSCLQLNAKKVNRIYYTIENELSTELVNTTGIDVIFRMKKDKENLTTPLFEITATKTLETDTKSQGYWDVDLTTDPEDTYIDMYYWEMELNDGVNPPKIEDIQTLEIKITLDN
jgi:hypothetical protein